MCVCFRESRSQHEDVETHTRIDVPAQLKGWALNRQVPLTVAEKAMWNWCAKSAECPSPAMATWFLSTFRAASLKGAVLATFAVSMMVARIATAVRRVILGSGIERTHPRKTTLTRVPPRCQLK